MSQRLIFENQKQQYFDTDLGKPIWLDGTKWVDANGNQCQDARK